MNILSLDTSTETLSIALQTESSYEERLVRGNFSHSENLLREIENMLGRASLKLSDLDTLICTQGPGSFTGLRVGMATLKAIRTGCGAKLVSIPTLEAIAVTAEKLYRGAVLSVIDAKKKRFYIELRVDGKVTVPVRDGNPEDIIDELGKYSNVLITGPDAEKFMSKIDTSLLPETSFIVDDGGMRNLSKALIKLGLERLETVGEDEIGSGPIYVRRSDAEEALLKKIRENENR